MSKLKSLKTTLDQAMKTFLDLQHGKQAKFNELLDIAKAEISIQLASLDPGIIDAKIAAQEASTAYLKEAIRVAREEAIPWPEGTIVSRPAKGAELKRRRGVIEIWTSDSRSPDNVARSFPQVGEPVVRYLNADGTKGKGYEHLVKWRVGDWVAENETEPKLEPEPDFIRALRDEK